MMLGDYSCGSPEAGVALWAVSCTLNAFSEGNVSPPFILPTDSLLLHAVYAQAAIAMNKPARACRGRWGALDRVAVIGGAADNRAKIGKCCQLCERRLRQRAPPPLAICFFS